jgi:hypothetical protein
MSTADFAAYLKKRAPELAQFPDDELVKGVLARRPDLASKVAQPAPETFLQKTWPTGATIGPPEKVEGLAALSKLIGEVRQKLSTRLFGVQPEGGAGEALFSPALGTLRAARGVVDLSRAAGGQGPGTWSGAKDIGLGGLQAAALPLAFLGAAPEARTVSTAATARKLTNIVNPAAKEIPEFEATLTKHLDKVLTYAQRSGLKISDPEQLVKAIRDTGDALKGHFDARILAPVRSVRVPVATEIPGYAGRAEQGVATLGDLNDRLAQIHAELFPKYAQQGLRAEQAVKSAADLKNEADAIRRVFYPALEKTTGIPQGQLAELREAFGELNAAADQGRQAVTEARHAANVRAAQPKALKVRAGEAVRRVTPRVAATQEEARAAAQAKQVRRAIEGLSHYGEGGVYEPPGPFAPAGTEPAPGGPAAPFPRSQFAKPAGIETGVGGSTAAEREAQLEKLAQRGQRVRAEQAAKQARVGGARLARRPAGAGEGPPFAETGEITEAERQAQAERTAKRAAEVRARRAARKAQIEAARAARRRPPEAQ